MWNQVRLRLNKVGLNGKCGIRYAPANRAARYNPVYNDRNRARKNVVCVQIGVGFSDRRWGMAEKDAIPRQIREKKFFLISIITQKRAVRKHG